MRGLAKRLRPAEALSFLFPSASDGLERDHGSARAHFKGRKAFAASACWTLRHLDSASDQIRNDLAQTLA